MPGDFQTYFPKVYDFRPHMRHIRTSGMADSELFQRHSDQLLDRSRGRFAQNAPQNLLGRGAGEAQHGQRRKGLVEAPARPGLGPSVVGARRHELAAQLDDDLLRRFQPQSLDIFEKDGVFGSDDPLQLPRRIGRENHPGGIAAYAGDTYQVAEQFPFGLRREAVKQLGVFPNHVMNEQFHSVGVLDFGICLQRYLKKVPHSADIQHGMGGSEFGNGTGEIFVHEFLILNVA